MMIRLAETTGHIMFCAFALMQTASAQTNPTATDHSNATIVQLPVRYAADRFYVAPVTEGGDTLLFYTDTGGGANFFYADAVEAQGLPVDWLVQGNDSVGIVELPAFEIGAGIPAPSLAWRYGPRLIVTEERFTDGAGFLGRTWFAGRVWAFDYPGRSLGLVIGYDRSAWPSEHSAKLFFQKDAAGQRTTHFPRIRLEIAGDSLDMLFDTGATVHLTESAVPQLEDGDNFVERGTSFIVKSIFERWRTNHPEWPVIEHAERGSDRPMIQVPELSIAGYTVGPVWFTLRPDRNFYDYMSQWMDKPVDGALGGSALQYFRIIVDYPNAAAYFLRP